jgi:hypothetical protein
MGIQNINSAALGEASTSAYRVRGGGHCTLDVWRRNGECGRGDEYVTHGVEGGSRRAWDYELNVLHRQECWRWLLYVINCRHSEEPHGRKLHNTYGDVKPHKIIDMVRSRAERNDTIL